jgi:hypothetical protein
VETITNTHFRCTVLFKNPSVYDIMWKNMALPDRPHMSIKYCAEIMGFVWRIAEARIKPQIREYLIHILFPW